MYATGGFDFPTVTGAHSVTGLGFQPQAVIMFCGNKATVGTLMTGLTGPGVGASINAISYGSSSAITSFFLGLNGNASATRGNYRGYQGCISMMTDATGAGVIDYRADTITFDTGGFTINVTHAATGVRPIHWLAWGGPTMLTQFRSGQFNGTLTHSFNPLSTIGLATLATDTFGEGSIDGECHYSFGSGHFPAYAAGNDNEYMASAIYDQYDASGLGGSTEGFQRQSTFDDTQGLTNIGTVTFVSSWIESLRYHKVNTANLSEILNNSDTGASHYSAFVSWNGEGWTDLVTSPVTITPPPAFNRFEAMIFSTTNGADDAGGPAHGTMRYGFGVLTNDYQGCVVFGPDGSFYQSDTECVANCTAAGVNAASGVINPNGTVTLTDTQGAGAKAVYHGFGRIRTFRPHIYRRVFR